MKKLLLNVWPKNDWRTRGAVLLGFAFLITGKVFVASDVLEPVVNLMPRS